MRIIIGLFFLLFFFLSPPVFSATIDLNTATVEQLQTVKGIGIKTAEAIVDYRQSHGHFASLDDLTQVKGIGDKKLAKVREQLSVGDIPEAKQTPSKSKVTETTP